MKMLAFTRPEDRLASSILLAEEMGFKTMAAPSLKVSSGDEESLVRFHNNLLKQHYDCLIFTSATAVQEVLNYLENADDKPVNFDDIEVIAIGMPTKKKLNEMGIMNVAIPEEYTSAGLLVDFGKSLAMKRVCLLRSDKGTPVLKLGLEALGTNVDEVFVYRLEPAPITDEMKLLVDSASKGMIDVFAFTSALSAKTFFEAAVQITNEVVVRDFLSRSFVAAIGKPTSEELESIGIRVDLVPSKADFEIMLCEIDKHFRSV